MNMGTRPFQLVSEEKIYGRYLTLYNRKIKFSETKEKQVDTSETRNRKFRLVKISKTALIRRQSIYFSLQAATFEYDVVGHPQSNFHFSTVFPFHPGSHKSGKVTLLREHCQGPNEMMYVLPTGGFNAKVHADWLECAKAEMSEEARLRSGEWHCLLPENHPGIAEVKWCANRFTPFLCISPQKDELYGARDEEEYIEIHTVDVLQLREIMASGNMLLPSLSTCYMAMDRLSQMGYL